MKSDNPPFGYRLLSVIRDDIKLFFKSNSHTVRARFPSFLCLDATSLNDSDYRSGYDLSHHTTSLTGQSTALQATWYTKIMQTGPAAGCGCLIPT